MTDQPQLQFSNDQSFTPESSVAAGPIFETEPGWGGKLSAWFGKSLSLILPILALMVLGAGLTIYFTKTRNSPATPQDKNSAPAVTHATFKQTAQRGQGVTHLARQATAEYLAVSPQDWVTLEHKIYVEDYLKDLKGESGLEVGESVEFSATDIQNGIERAKKLKPEELENLTKYVKRVTSSK